MILKKQFFKILACHAAAANTMTSFEAKLIYQNNVVSNIGQKLDRNYTIQV